MPTASATALQEEGHDILLEHILSYLADDWRSLLAASSVTRRWSNVVTSSPVLQIILRSAYYGHPSAYRRRLLRTPTWATVERMIELERRWSAFEPKRVDMVDIGTRWLTAHDGLLVVRTRSGRPERLNPNGYAPDDSWAVFDFSLPLVAAGTTPTPVIKVVAPYHFESYAVSRAHNLIAVVTLPLDRRMSLNQTLEIRLFLLDAADDNGDAITHPAAAVPLLVVKTRFTERQLAWSEQLEYSRRYHLNIIGDYLHYNSEVCEPHWARTWNWRTGEEVMTCKGYTHDLQTTRYLPTGTGALFAVGRTFRGNWNHFEKSAPPEFKDQRCGVVCPECDKVTGHNGNLDWQVGMGFLTRHPDSETGTSNVPQDDPLGDWEQAHTTPDVAREGWVDLFQGLEVENALFQDYQQDRREPSPHWDLDHGDDMPLFISNVDVNEDADLAAMTIQIAHGRSCRLNTVLTVRTSSLRQALSSGLGSLQRSRGLVDWRPDTRGSPTLSGQRVVCLGDINDSRENPGECQVYVTNYAAQSIHPSPLGAAGPASTSPAPTPLVPYAPLPEEFAWVNSAEVVNEGGEGIKLPPGWPSTPPITMPRTTVRRGIAVPYIYYAQADTEHLYILTHIAGAYDGETEYLLVVMTF